MQDQLESFLLYLKYERGSPRNTIDAYRRDIQKAIDYFILRGITDFVNVTTRHFVLLITFLNNNGLGANSIRRAIYAFKTLFIFLKREDLIPVDVTKSLEVPKTWKKVIQVLHYEEIETILEKPSKRTQNGVFARAILELLYGSGLRASEVGQIKWYDLNYSQKILRVTGKGGKQRLVPLNDKCIEAIKLYSSKCRTRKKGKDHVFVTQRGNPIDRIQVWRVVKKYAKCHPHLFRHSFASHMYRNDAELRVLQEMLGHSDVSSTQVYLHTDFTHLQKKFNQFHLRP